MRKNSLLVAAVMFSTAAYAVAADPKNENIFRKFPQPLAKASKKTSSATIVSLRDDSDSKDKEQPNSNTLVTVLPETSTVVMMNNSDVNRIVCPVDIKDVVSLKEKGVSVKVTGRDAFVNFKFIKKGEKTLFATEPTEMYVVCGQDTYNLILMPKSNVAPQTIRLSSGIEKKIKNNNDLLGSLPFEKKVMRVVKDVYTDQLADSYSVTDIRKQVGNWQEITVIHKRNVEIDGEGLRVREYEANLKQGQVPFKLSEKIFTKKTFADNPVAVSLEKHIIRPGETVRIFVVEQRQEKLPNALYLHKETTELNPLDDQLAMRAYEATAEPEEKTPNKNSDKSGDSEE